MLARRALPVRIAGEERYVAIEDAGRLRDALGTALPVGVPEVFTEPVADPLGDLVGRYARTHGPFQPGEVATRLGLGVAVVTATLQRLTAHRPAGHRRVPSRRLGAGVVRRRGAAVDPAAQPGQAAPGGRAGPDRHARPLHAVLAVRGQPAARGGRRPRGRRAAGRCAGAGQRAGVARAAGPRARLLPRDARRADQRRRGAVGRRRRAARRRRLDQPACRPTSPPLLLPEPLAVPEAGAPILDQLAGGQALFFRGLSDLVGATDDTGVRRPRLGSRLGRCR